MTIELLLTEQDKNKIKYDVSRSLQITALERWQILTDLHEIAKTAYLRLRSSEDSYEKSEEEN